MAGRFYLRSESVSIPESVSTVREFLERIMEKTNTKVTVEKNGLVTVTAGSYRGKSKRSRRKLVRIVINRLVQQVSVLRSKRYIKGEYIMQKG